MIPVFHRVGTSMDEEEYLVNSPFRGGRIRPQRTPQRQNNNQIGRMATSGARISICTLLVLFGLLLILPMRNGQTELKRQEIDEKDTVDSKMHKEIRSKRGSKTGVFAINDGDAPSPMEVEEYYVKQGNDVDEEKDETDKVDIAVDDDESSEDISNAEFKDLTDEDTVSNASEITSLADTNSTMSPGKVTENNSSNSSIGEEEVLLETISSALLGNNVPALNCSREELKSMDKSSRAYLVYKAECGYGYDPSTQSDKSTIHVTLYGRMIKHNLLLSGCKIGNRCPLHPKCKFTDTLTLTSGSVVGADVLVAANDDAGHIQNVEGRFRKPKIRVLYWREPYWNAVSAPIQRHAFDLVMGVFMNADIINPNFHRRPHNLLNTKKVWPPPVPLNQRKFGISITSVCQTGSHREIYLAHLTAYLGPERVHRYGECGNQRLPPPPMINAAKVIASYKFYFSFESTIIRSYVTEKLFVALMLPILPVYMGERVRPNITTIPSFIEVMDFRTPKDLALYLLYLDENDAAYNEYHKWRTSENYFTNEYLELLSKQVPSHEEMTIHQHNIRRALCCRLCNKHYLQAQMAQRSEERIIKSRWSAEMVDKRFFGGQMGKHIGKNQLLKPAPKRG